MSFMICQWSSHIIIKRQLRYTFKQANDQDNSVGEEAIEIVSL